MKKICLLVATLFSFSCSLAQATVFQGAMDNRAGFPNAPGFTAQSLAWIVGGARGEGLRLEWQADDETTPGFWTYTYKLIRGSARNKGFAFFDIETASDFTAANITGSQILSATNNLGNPLPLSGITISSPVTFNTAHDFSNAAVSEASSITALNKTELAHYSGDPGRTLPFGQPGGSASATPTVGPVPHPFYGIRVTFPGSFTSLSYVVSAWEFRIVSNRVPMWGSFFGWGDQTTAAPFWYANVYNDMIDTPVTDTSGRLTLAPANNLTGADPYRGWILVPGPRPAVIASNPAGTATGVAVTEPVTAVFSGLMNPVTITPATFTLSDGVNAISGTVSYDGATRTATFTPGAPLVPGAYTATLTTAVKDLAGNALAQNRVWSFTTNAADQTPPTVTSQLPPDGASNVATSTTITAVFSEEIAPASLSTATFTIADSSGPISGTVTYIATTRTASFTPLAPLANNTLYTATITSGVKDLASTANSLAQNKVWSFTTIPRETILPVISTTIPSNLAVGVPVFNPISATFSEAIDPTTLNPASFTLAGVTGAVTYDGTTRTASFTPDSPLANNTTYSATITTAVKDLAGNALPLSREWSFTTGPPDSILPTVTGTQPANSAINVPLASTISAVFSEQMAPATVGLASFSLTGQTYSTTAPFTVNGTISNNSFIPIASFIPATPLAMGTTYTATISTAATDLAGNHLAVPATWSFVTLPDGIMIPGESATTIADALKALRIAVGLIAASADDMNHGDVAPLGLDGKPLPDGQITIQDALLLLRKTVGLITW
ncbi:MAG: Ig-like domain-containing protein [Desulfuromonadales bacterium]|nr:Ig-like domain-containing protein [Desulfuromonadales bacterium]